MNHRHAEEKGKGLCIFVNFARDILTTQISLSSFSDRSLMETVVAREVCMEPSGVGNSGVLPNIAVGRLAGYRYQRQHLLV